MSVLARLRHSQGFYASAGSEEGCRLTEQHWILSSLFTKIRRRAISHQEDWENMRGKASQPCHRTGWGLGLDSRFCSLLNLGALPLPRLGVLFPCSALSSAPWFATRILCLVPVFFPCFSSLTLLMAAAGGRVAAESCSVKRIGRAAASSRETARPWCR